MAERGAEVGFEEGLSWLPAYLLHEACGDFDRKEQVGSCASHNHQHFNHVNNGLKTNLLPQQGKSGRKYNNKPRNGLNSRASGGPGMQAIFLDPGHKPCGTGVFLPTRVGTQIQPSKKPACSAVLLPSRVVQALNINVQDLGVQISPSQDSKNHQKGRITDNLTCNKEEKDARDRYYVVSQDPNSSPELFLPKEWSY